ncbi:hypothetical protein [Aureimonas sp. AU12]|uniref:hypothetical protein n=1 Tax=Aureimonas sp. AU12 TaxID=1638161 RepID=UPI00078301EA|nr:hypothetical protein [Aureimonas sp. AU12]
MLATGLVFVLGALIASLVALLLVPLVWRKAQRLARRDFEATIPTSVNEIRAEVDAVRAASAFDIRRIEIQAREAREAGARERAEAGRIVVENGELRIRQAELQNELAAGAGALRRLEEKLEALTGERDELHETRQELRHKLQLRGEELEGLASKYQEMREAADDRRLALAAAETRILQLTDAMRAGTTRSKADAPAPAPVPAQVEAPVAPLLAAASLPTTGRPETVSGSHRLRAAIASRTGERRPASREENAEIRERISDIAARVIHKQVETDGPQSPVARIISESGPAQTSAAPTLADRVKRLMAGEDMSAGEPTLALAAPDETSMTPTLQSATTSEAAVSEPARPVAAKRNGGGRSRPRSRR